MARPKTPPRVGCKGCKCPGLALDVNDLCKRCRRPPKKLISDKVVGIKRSNKIARLLNREYLGLIGPATPVQPVIVEKKPTSFRPPEKPPHLRQRVEED